MGKILLLEIGIIYILVSLFFYFFIKRIGLKVSLRLAISTLWPLAIPALVFLAIVDFFTPYTKEDLAA
jgi:hypothetical protein